MSVIDKIEAGAYDSDLPRKTNEDRVARRHHERQLRAKLKADLESDYSLSSHPKRDALWTIAWEEGHSSGYHEVVNWYEKLAELLKPDEGGGDEKL